MGWKNVKAHYKIKHTVHVTEWNDTKGIAIGSPYINTIIFIGFDGRILKHNDSTTNEDLTRYQKDLKEDPALLKRLIEQPDTFEHSIPVYTYDYTTGEILEKYCERLGWPNVTHDGELMYDNTFSADKAVVIAWAKGHFSLAVDHVTRDVKSAQENLAERIQYLQRQKDNLAKLETLYPDIQ